jgi:hypothetical protein
MPKVNFNIRSINKILLFEFAIEFVSLMRISVHFLSIAFLVSFLVLTICFFGFPIAGVCCSAQYLS